MTGVQEIMPKKAKATMIETLMKNQPNTFRSIFQRKKSKNDEDSSPTDSPKSIPQLSPFANSVVTRCSKILQISTEEMQQLFDSELPGINKEPETYSRSLLEFCSYQTLYSMSKRPDYLSNKDFRRLAYDIMLAWECPGSESEPLPQETASCSNEEVEDKEEWSLFYSNSTNMAVQFDDKKTVGPEAFARIAPACTALADIITVHNLFDSLTSSSGRRLHYLVFDKYIRSLDKIIKATKNALHPSTGNLHLSEGEIVLEVDGTVPTQPVLQHIGISAWPGRLTLTSHALYFESLGVGLYDKAVRYDLEADTKQRIKPELTGPLGARLFDKAVMYKSTSVTEPVYLEFPEFKGSSRRDYWLDICLEILRAHKFIRKNNLNETQKSEVLARAVFGIFRIRAIREAFHVFSSHYRTVLTFNLAESLPGGDSILETLLSRLLMINIDGIQRDVSGSPPAKQQRQSFPIFLLALSQLGFTLQKEIAYEADAVLVGDIWAGETNPLEIVVRQSISDSGRAEAAQATVDQVKVEGIDTNLAVMKELLSPFLELVRHIQILASWEDTKKSTAFLLLFCYAIIRNWTRFILPCILVFLAVLMLCRRQFGKSKPLEPFRITSPPNRNAVEQLLTLQEVITQVEALIQDGNIFLLKIRALLFAVRPQATDMVALLLIFAALVFAFLPFKYIVMLALVEAYTREMPYRKETSNKWIRRAREWWIRIPAAPVQLVKHDDNKKKKS
ncbi:uncharacterized protein LOC111489145 isoform X1 [Cucurbita maxima]|uniref:Uncharacterized protein LOC111489145 isoform X1 n=1 Tax=Cucurbita maxima TaxID=3661 RepID=A0A6J1JX86_CUCMA|nr:uncharacterized protein LOC111489145 isoform X1 [Cucurbita maxima]XP_022992981.1 uncharacterized protein LOC111489145 isoform X1 [Cucurbita maxima]